MIPSKFRQFNVKIYCLNSIKAVFSQTLLRELIESAAWTVLHIYW